MLTSFDQIRCLHLQAKNQINVGEHRRSNQKWTIQRNWQHRAHKTNKKRKKKTKKKTKLNKHNKTEQNKNTTFI